MRPFKSTFRCPVCHNGTFKEIIPLTFPGEGVTVAKCQKCGCAISGPDHLFEPHRSGNNPMSIMPGNR